MNKGEIPARGPALAGRSFVVTFDVDCGELLPGHNFVARGLSDSGAGSGPDDDEPPTQLISLEYELVPGVPQSESHDIWGYLVGIEYAADVELPWAVTDGGAIAPFEGGATTHGSRGSWPIPEGARHLTFDLYPVRAGERWPDDRPAGQLVVDLHEQVAHWKAA